MARRKHERPWQKKDTEALARELTKEPPRKRLVFVAEVTCDSCFGKGVRKFPSSELSVTCPKCEGIGQIARYVKLPFKGAWEFVDETLKGERR